MIYFVIVMTFMALCGAWAMIHTLHQGYRSRMLLTSSDIRLIIVVMAIFVLQFSWGAGVIYRYYF